MRKNALKVAIVLVATLIAVPFVSGMAEAKPQPALVIVGPSNATVETGGTIVLRGSLIRGSADGIALKLSAKSDTSSIHVFPLKTVQRNNSVSTTIRLKSDTIKPGPVSGTLTLTLGAAGQGYKDSVEKTMNITVTESTLQK